MKPVFAFAIFLFSLSAQAFISAPVECQLVDKQGRTHEFATKRPQNQGEVGGYEANQPRILGDFRQFQFPIVTSTIEDKSKIAIKVEFFTDVEALVSGSGDPQGKIPGAYYQETLDLNTDQMGYELVLGESGESASIVSGTCVPKLISSFIEKSGPFAQDKGQAEFIQNMSGQFGSPD